MFAGGALLFVAFVLVERRAAEPVLPPWVVSRRLLATTAMVAFGVGAVMLGITSYVPTFLVGALSTSPIVAGLALAALTIGWPISASQSGRLYLRIGFRNTALIGITVTVIGTAVLAVTASVPNVALVAVSCFIVGLGLGLVATPTLIAAQTSVEWNERGVVTGTNLFARSIGSSIGVAVFGAIANAVYAGTPHGDTDPHTIVAASSAVFLAVMIAAVLTVVAVLGMPATKPVKQVQAAARGSSQAADDPGSAVTFGVLLGRSSPDAEGGDEIFVQFEPDAVEGVAVCGGEPRRLRGCVFHCQLEAFRVSAEPRQHSGQADFQIAEGRQRLGEGLLCWLVDPIVGLTSLGEPAELEFAAGGHDSCVQGCKLRVHGGDCCLAAHAVQLLGQEPFVFSPAGHGQGPAPVSPE